MHCTDGTRRHADQLQQLQAAQRRSAQTSRTSAVVGGLSGGGVALAAAGAVLGPLGLLGGALVGWKLASVMAGHRNLEQARAGPVPPGRDRRDDAA